MSEETIRTILVACIPAFFVYLNERRKINTTSQLSVYDKQKDWIEKLENELEERDRKIEALEDVVRKLEARIKELKVHNETNE